MTVKQGQKALTFAPFSFIIKVAWKRYFLSRKKVQIWVEGSCFMKVDVQKGSIWKRISAFLFDGIMLSIVIMGLATLMSWILKYDDRMAAFNEIKESVAAQYGISFDTSQEEYQEFDAEKKARFDEAYEALNANREAVKLYSQLNVFAILIISLPMFLAFLILEFIIPLIFKDGRTLGKKIFGLCVIRPNCVKISGPVLFIRSIIGKCVIELQIPATIIIMFLFGKGNIFLAILFFAIPLVNLISFFATKKHTVLHDLLSVTVVADYASQRIFETEDELIEFKKKQHEEEVQRLREPEYSHI